MLFDSALRKELGRSFGATLVVLVTIVMTMMLIRTLRLAARGSVSPQDVLLVMGYTGLGHLPTVLTLSLFIALIATMSRMYQDSEMVIWFASGTGLMQFVRPIFRLAWPLLLLIGVLALFAWPWTNDRSALLREQFESRSDIARVAPGEFQVSRSGDTVFFIDRDAGATAAQLASGLPDLVDAATGRNVFIVTRTESVEAVTSAKEGRIERIGGDRFVVLSQGQRVEIDLRQGDRTVALFDTYGVLLDDRGAAISRDRPPRARSTLDLVREPTPAHLAELTWRVGLVLGPINLLLLGLGLSAMNPRAGRSWNLILGLLSFIVYFNLLNLSQVWVHNGTFGVGTSLLAIHGGTFVLACVLLWWRQAGWMMRWPHWRSRAAGAP